MAETASDPSQEPEVKPMSSAAAGEAQRAGLTDAAASAKVVRGGMVRTVGYVLGAMANLAGSVLLLRHLGVEQFGSYVAVTSLVAMAGGLADGGLTAVGNRELAVAKTIDDRRVLSSRLLGMRLLITPAAMGLAVLYSVVARYPAQLVLGTVLAGVGWTLVVASSSVAMPLSVDLRIVSLTALDVLKQVGTTVTIVVLVLTGAGMLPFYGATIPAALTALGLTPLLISKGSVGWPTFRVRAWGDLLRKSLTIALATAVGAVYLRLLTVLVFQLSDEENTGLFGVSARLIEAIVGLPLLVFLIALPVMSRAAVADRDRLRAFFLRMVEVSSVLSWFLVTLLVVAAQPIVLAVGGAQYLEAVPILRVQALALVGALLAMACAMAAIALDLDRAILLANGTALACAVLVGVPAVAHWGAMGAAVATVVGDVAMAAVYCHQLGRADLGMRPRLRHMWKSILASALAVGAALVTTGNDVIASVVALVVFLVVALVLRAVPYEVVDGLRRRD